jgi:uncharacterized membrane protein YoaK (UPF0700 family)
MIFLSPPVLPALISLVSVFLLEGLSPPVLPSVVPVVSVFFMVRSY